MSTALSWLRWRDHKHHFSWTVESFACWGFFKKNKKMPVVQQQSMRTLSPWIPLTYPTLCVWTCVITESFANGFDAGGHDYLCRLPWCFKIAHVTLRGWVGVRFEKLDGTRRFLAVYYGVVGGAAVIQRLQVFVEPLTGEAPSNGWKRVRRQGWGQ